MPLLRYSSLSFLCLLVITHYLFYSLLCNVKKISFDKISTNTIITVKKNDKTGNNKNF